MLPKKNWKFEKMQLLWYVVFLIMFFLIIDEIIFNSD